MTLLSDIYPHHASTPMFYMKFSQLEYLKPLEQGQLYMNNLQYFIDLEKETGQLGMGDMFEGASVVKPDKVVVALYKDEDEQIPSGKHFELNTSQITMRINGMKQWPVFCLFAVNFKMLKVIDEREEDYIVSIQMSDKQKETMIGEFGSHVFITAAHNFLEHITKAFKAQNILIFRGLIDYLPFLELSERTSDYIFHDDIKERIKVAFTKRSELAYQNEYRILIMNQPANKPTKINVGPIPNSLIIPVEGLTNGEYVFSVNKEGLGKPVTPIQ
ncbi:hypothetical protein CN918_30900 [Priestia megaterium]|nr:hypothetical protein CN918_30900 [Priestia megaterium]